MELEIKQQHKMLKIYVDIKESCALCIPSLTPPEKKSDESRKFL